MQNTGICISTSTFPVIRIRTRTKYPPSPNTTNNNNQLNPNQPKMRVPIPTSRTPPQPTTQPHSRSPLPKTTLLFKCRAPTCGTLNKVHKPRDTPRALLKKDLVCAECGLKVLWGLGSNTNGEAHGDKEVVESEEDMAKFRLRMEGVAMEEERLARMMREARAGVEEVEYV
ncbi:hypothetical protein P153DRAFT_390457 [Dothidotthia symphoricarpi CBS 119687]|uniref:Uncharacterized protein n=1 Tax=Dothidotthia symphoricarpi CBS 119687 TaxID=1392245 RepID=A0A6A5ZZG7_9PLEO|nr:uncharacterized protein P153DRAFT_390457 [Dothidotthia symphoricarpi CBS 119687]KAF2124415.1 hypothetical protein P153DRAFT_390457 [Dothidotthia symphoricarpi CBS 119687]